MYHEELSFRLSFKEATLKTRVKIFIVLLALGQWIVGCATPGKDTAIGAGAGAAVGAGVGALLDSKNPGHGALIGAGVGAIVGGTVGNILDAQEQQLKKVADTRRTKEGILVKLKSDILFDTGKSELKSAATDQLDQIGDILQQYPQDKIVVVGHTDNVGGTDFNQTLSQQRADAVKVEILSRGVGENSVSTVGLGESQPAASKTTGAGRQKNRRVELKITIPQSKS
jgi:outer membrane protein OmpA-like peptidoglycan-associated protein